MGFRSDSLSVLEKYGVCARCCIGGWDGSQYPPSHQTAIATIIELSVILRGGSLVNGALHPHSSTSYLHRLMFRLLRSLTCSRVLRVGIALHAEHALYSRQSALDGFEIGRQATSRAIRIFLPLPSWKEKTESQMDRRRVGGPGGVNHSPCANALVGVDELSISRSRFASSTQPHIVHAVVVWTTDHASLQSLWLWGRSTPVPFHSRPTCSKCKVTPNFPTKPP